MMNRLSFEYFLREEMKTAVCTTTIASYIGGEVEACLKELFSNLLR